jgi:cell division protein DivIC
VLKRILRIFINKYFITTLALLVWLFFFDSNNLLTRWRSKQKLNELKREKKFYEDEIRKDSVMTKNLQSDSLSLEKYAREKYLMKRDNEDLYLMIDSTEGQRR